jgi:uncharacterized protein (TIGR03067 family)
MANDFAKLQGAWTLRSLELDGQEMPAMGGIEIDGDRFTVNGMAAEYSGTMEIDPAAKPKRFDLVFTSGPEAGNRNRGIYDLTGDTWKVCLNMAGKARPRFFTSKPGSGNAVEVFERGAGASGTDEAPEDVVRTAAGQGELVGEWKMVAAFQSGHELDAAMAKTARRVTTATHTTTYFGNKVFLNAEYSTDPTQSPKTIDLRVKKGTQLGIYEVDGDILKICFAAPGKPRPAGFTTSAGDGHTSAVWKRVALP